MSKFTGCGCFLCRKGFANIVTELKDTNTPKQIILKLEPEYGVTTSLQTLARHLKNFDETSLPPIVEDSLEPIPGVLAVSLNEINFDRYPSSVTFRNKQVVNKLNYPEA